MSYFESTGILIDQLEKDLEARKRKWWEWHKENPVVMKCLKGLHSMPLGVADSIIHIGLL